MQHNTRTITLTSGGARPRSGGPALLGTPLATLLATLSVTAQCLCSQLAWAEENGAPQSLGLAPGTPQVGTLPGGTTPAYGTTAMDETDWRFDFHGFLTMPLRLGFNERQGTVTEEQYKTVLHAPPVTPHDRDTFSYTSALPDPYVQLNFSYGNSVVTGNVVVLSRTATTAASYFDGPKQSGITDAFLTFDLPDLPPSARTQIHVGAFTNRFGAMGQYDEGRYGTPIIARLNGVGESIVTQLELGDIGLEFQQGFQAQLDKPPPGILPAPENDFADPATGTGLAHHLHAGLTYSDAATLGLHFINALTADDRASQGRTADGNITVLGADLRLSLKRFGHLYVAASHTNAEESRSVGRIIEILNTPGGPGLIRNYLGPDSDGNGSLMTVGGQYDFSLARFFFPGEFKGIGQDVVIGLFGMHTSVSSDDDNYDGMGKLKVGGELGWSALSWLATSLRYDYVSPDSDNGDAAFSIISPRVIFRTDWQAHDQVTLQYSRFVYGDDVVVRSGVPPMDDPSIDPDADVVSLSATMWW